MKNRKAPGWDNITVEHIKYAGDVCTETLRWILNATVSTEDIPVQLKKGLISPIPKPGEDQTIKDCNRGITLISVFLKLLERIMLSREKEWLSHPDVIDDLQGAGQNKCSSLHTSMLLQEVIQANVEKAQSVYVAFLDIKKAFDTVWVPGLLYKLHKAGMSGKIWRLIKESYQGFQCAAFIAGEVGEWFHTERGVHQGAPLSMRLYQIYINDLLQDLRASIYGVELAGINVTCPSFADDTTIVTLNKPALNILLRITSCHGRKWQYECNVEKSVVMVWGKDEQSDLQAMLGDEALKMVNVCRHLGIDLVSDNKLIAESYSRRIGQSQKAFSALRGLGSEFLPVPPNVLSKLYWSVVIPKMTYGMEIVPITEAGMLELKKVHRNNARVIQNLPVSTPTPSTLATVGWLSIDAFICMRKLTFLWHILCMPVSNIYRRLVILLMQQCLINGSLWNTEMRESPVIDMFRVAHRYGMTNLLRHCYLNKDFGAFTARKSLVKRVVWEYEWRRWRASCVMYPRLETYNSIVNDIKMNVWWIFCKYNPE